MSKRNKLMKFAEILSFPNVYENFDVKNPGLVGQGGAKVSMRGRWREQHFGNKAPLILELACGRGEYTLALAAHFKEQNFIGVDIKGARIWKGAKMALEQQLDNAAFLRTRIEQIELFFTPEEVDEIWITFPDPFLKKGKANRRLTSASFLDRYRKILKKGGLLHLKTDDPTLYNFTLETLWAYPHAEVLYQDSDIYSRPLPNPALQFNTYYEDMHLRKGRTIKYVQFRLK